MLNTFETKTGLPVVLLQQLDELRTATQAQLVESMDLFYELVDRCDLESSSLLCHYTDLLQQCTITNQALRSVLKQIDDLERNILTHTHAHAKLIASN